MKFSISTLTILCLPTITTSYQKSYCPSYHTILGHYDPSGPILVDGVWHVFPDGGEGGHWGHYHSKDLLHWESQDGDTLLANGDTGSLSVTDAGFSVHFPELSLPTLGLNKQTPTDDSFNTWSESTHVADKPTEVGQGFRDPHRAIKMDDGNWYIGVGSGYGGENDDNQLPTTGTGCLAWMKATDSSLESFEYTGCLLENNHTMGHIDPGTVAYQVSVGKR